MPKDTSRRARTKKTLSSPGYDGKPARDGTVALPAESYGDWGLAFPLQEGSSRAPVVFGHLPGPIEPTEHENGVSTTLRTHLGLSLNAIAGSSLGMQRPENPYTRTMTASPQHRPGPRVKKRKAGNGIPHAKPLTEEQKAERDLRRMELVRIPLTNSESILLDNQKAAAAKGGKVPRQCNPPFLLRSHWLLCMKEGVKPDIADDKIWEIFLAAKQITTEVKEKHLSLEIQRYYEQRAAIYDAHHAAAFPGYEFKPVHLTKEQKAEIERERELGNLPAKKGKGKGKASLKARGKKALLRLPTQSATQTPEPQLLLTVPMDFEFQPQIAPSPTSSGSVHASGSNSVRPSPHHLSLRLPPATRPPITPPTLGPFFPLSLREPAHDFKQSPAPRAPSPLPDEPLQTTPLDDTSSYPRYEVDVHNLLPVHLTTAASMSEASSVAHPQLPEVAFAQSQGHELAPPWYSNPETLDQLVPAYLPNHTPEQMHGDYQPFANYSQSFSPQTMGDSNLHREPLQPADQQAQATPNNEVAHFDLCAPPAPYSAWGMAFDTVLVGC